MSKLKQDEVEVIVDAIAIKEGDSIEDVMKARGYEPVGEKCEGCGVHHEWKDKDGHTGFIADVDVVHAEEPAPKDQAAKQVRALRSINARIAEVREALELLEKLRDSIARPLDTKRVMLDMLTEVGMATRAKELLSGGL